MKKATAAFTVILDFVVSHRTLGKYLDTELSSRRGFFSLKDDTCCFERPLPGALSRLIFLLMSSLGAPEMDDSQAVFFVRRFSWPLLTFRVLPGVWVPLRGTFVGAGVCRQPAVPWLHVVGVWPRAGATSPWGRRSCHRCSWAAAGLIGVWHAAGSSAAWGWRS